MFKEFHEEVPSGDVCGTTISVCFDMRE